MGDDTAPVACTPSVGCGSSQPAPYDASPTEGEELDTAETLGLATLAVAIASLLILVGQEIRRRLVRPDVSWRGTSEARHSTEKFRLTNSGDQAATEIQVQPHGCSTVERELGWVFIRIAPGESEVFEVTGGSDSSWLHVMWKSPHHANRMVTTWLPLRSGTELEEVRFQQSAMSWQERLRLPRLQKMLASPDSVLRSSLPGSPRKQLKLQAAVARRLEKREAKLRGQPKL